ncbi:hypothetical protein J5N97_003596 [Dioscorea zingiberensis]|uniref:Uncharacterized protein n=1 Tax=Dioscorea zingiberensis TaxID=325984 RepID=A0A9D5D6Z7_9LILI|nr:hypothetical protein J5N97_003596 [Dioscorea zingiberensis]
MVSSSSSAVHSQKLSTVVPGAVTGDEVVHELGNMDLVMKQHYLRGVYLFKGSDAIEGLGIIALKEPMFAMLNVFYPVAGRIRRSESGRPFIRCNDSGVRIIEAKCDKTIDEWLLESQTEQYYSLDFQLVTDKVLGPDLPFSPSVYIQFTRFKCGGMAIGFSWAHVLGDAVSATTCINLWGQLLSKKKTPAQAEAEAQQVKDMINKATTKSTPDETPISLPVKQLPPVGDYWLSPSDHPMGTFSFQISSSKMKDMQLDTSFEVLSALIWKCLASIREGSREPHLVTICRSSSSNSEKKPGVLSNDQMITSVHCESSLSKIGISELAELIDKERVDQKKQIEDLVDSETGEPNFILYGANLTFVDLEQVDFYGLEINGQKPVHVNFKIDGVGSEGVVLVLPGTKKNINNASGDGEAAGRMVTVMLPEDEISKLKEVLKIEWNIV